MDAGADQGIARSQLLHNVHVMWVQQLHPHSDLAMDPVLSLLLHSTLSAAPCKGHHACRRCLHHLGKSGAACALLHAGAQGLEQVPVPAQDEHHRQPHAALPKAAAAAATAAASSTSALLADSRTSGTSGSSRCH
jgi:hypothetical protein